MTVAIATIATDGMIFGAADTMLTSGDIEFEPIRSASPNLGKIAPLTASIMALWAGDAAIQAEIILSHLQPMVKAAIDKEKRWLGVEEVVFMYIDAYNMVKHRRAQTQILSPLGLTFDSFISRQKEMSPEFVQKVGRALSEFALSPIETIITGNEPNPIGDGTRPRIYKLQNDDAVCYDFIRFAAIGGGSRHAESHLMLSRHCSLTPPAQALLATYIAKKKSEIAPGVGTETNFAVIGSALGAFNWLPEHIMNQCHAAYEEWKKREAASIKTAENEFDSYLMSIAQAATRDQAEAQKEQPQTGPSTTDAPTPPPAAPANP